MLKAIGTLRLVRPLVTANLAAQSKPQLVKSDFHTSAKRLGGGDQEFLVMIKFPPK